MPDPAPTFTGLHFWVADMPAAVRFYRTVGVAIPVGAEDGPFVNIELPGGQAFAFGTNPFTRGYDPAFEDRSGPNTNCLQFSLESRPAVDEMYSRLLAAGGHSHLAPIDAFWGSRYAEVLDPDGNVLGFHSPRDTAMGGPPPA